MNIWNLEGTSYRQIQSVYISKFLAERKKT